MFVGHVRTFKICQEIVYFQKAAWETSETLSLQGFNTVYPGVYFKMKYRNLAVWLIPVIFPYSFTEHQQDILVTMKVKIWLDVFFCFFRQTYKFRHGIMKLIGRRDG